MKSIRPPRLPIFLLGFLVTVVTAAVPAAAAERMRRAIDPRSNY